MNIFIDESGSFVSARKENSWNCVVAYISPEVDTRGVRGVLNKLKKKSKINRNDEVKLKNIKEKDYFEFLNGLSERNGVLFSVATDAGYNSVSNIKFHQRDQVDKILKNKPKMKYKGGKQGIQLLSDQLSNLSPQLYAQLHCQVNLIHDIIQRGVLYFVQRYPKSLGSFRWRIDQKNTSKTVFEDAFEKITPALLQTKSLRDPLSMLEGANYNAFSRYEFKKGEEPTYLKEVYGINIDADKGINVGKLIREDIKFVDSKKDRGVQVVDLLASGLRRCLRNGFRDNLSVGMMLGKLMVQDQNNKLPIHLISFKGAFITKENPTYAVVRRMANNCRPMLNA